MTLTLQIRDVCFLIGMEMVCGAPWSQATLHQVYDCQGAEYKEPQFKKYEFPSDEVVVVLGVKPRHTAYIQAGYL